MGGSFGIVLGCLVIGIFLYPTPSGTAQDQLRNYNAGTWEVIGILDVLIMLVGIPFAAYLRTALEGKSPGTASAAAILFIVGLAIAAGASAIQASAMSTLSSTYTSTSSSAADRAAAVLVTTLLSQFSMNLFPLVLLVAGVVLFSVASLNSRIIANWVADVGIASVVAVILFLALSPFVSSTSFVAFLVTAAFLILLLVWVFGSAAYLLRSARTGAVGAPAPA